MHINKVIFDSKPQFAGHETFPLRLLWLKKAFDAVGEGIDPKIFQEPDAVNRFGVGRNMAASIRYWALASGFFVIDGLMQSTALGKAILADDGLDPYLEQLPTVWLAHWSIASSPAMTTTIYYAFNHLNAMEFDAALLLDELSGLVEANSWRASRGTLKRDIEVFLRGYMRRGSALNEDAAEPLLAELAMIREAPIGGWFKFARGPKPSLPDAVFVLALGDFWERSGGSTTMTAESICYAPGSPGRVFKLDEDSVVTRLMRLEDLTAGAWRWVDTAGLRQVQRYEDFDPMSILASGFTPRLRFESAA